MVSFTVRFTFATEDRAEIAEALRLLTTGSRQEPGCVSYIPHHVEVIPTQSSSTSNTATKRLLLPTGRRSTSRNTAWAGSSKR